MLKKLILLFTFTYHALALECAISVGYPPFQYTIENFPAGIDNRIVQEFNRTSSIKIKLTPMIWDEALSQLFFTKKIQCVFGMEINDARDQRYLITKPIYQRRSALFVLADSDISSLDDLIGKKIATDLDSQLETELKKSKKYRDIRFASTQSKAESLIQLKSKTVKAAIMPERVGLYLARELGVEIKILHKAKIPTRVGIALNKDNLEGFKLLQKELDNFDANIIERIFKDY